VEPPVEADVMIPRRPRSGAVPRRFPGCWRCRPRPCRRPPRDAGQRTRRREVGRLEVDAGEDPVVVGDVADLEGDGTGVVPERDAVDDDVVDE
jgi:hypothetical protein